MRSQKLLTVTVFLLAMIGAGAGASAGRSAYLMSGLRGPEIEAAFVAVGLGAGMSLLLLAFKRFRLRRLYRSRVSTRTVTGRPLAPRTGDSPVIKANSPPPIATKS